MKVQVTHRSLTSDEAKKAPRRDPVPVGTYHATIMNVSTGTTNHNDNPLMKISVEFQILFSIDPETGEKKEDQRNRRVYQDYILEHDDSRPDLSEQRRYELRQLLDACDADFNDEGFDTDDLQERTVVITVRHRESNKVDDEGNKRIFTNVSKVDTAEEIAEGDVI